jgi:hypothetical protein
MSQYVPSDQLIYWYQKQTMTVDALTSWNASVRLPRVYMLPTAVPFTELSKHFLSFEKKNSR